MRNQIVPILVDRISASEICAVSPVAFDRRVRPTIRSIRVGKLVRFFREDVEAAAKILGELTHEDREHEWECGRDGFRIRQRRGHGTAYSIRFMIAGHRREYGLGTSDMEEADLKAQAVFGSELEEERRDRSAAAASAAMRLFAGLGELYPPETPGVYCILGPSGHVKIGSASNIRNRIQTLQTSSPVRLRLMAILSTDVRCERSIRRDLTDGNAASGEWLRMSPRICRTILTCRGIQCAEKKR